MKPIELQVADACKAKNILVEVFKTNPLCENTVIFYPKDMEQLTTAQEIQTQALDSSSVFNINPPEFLVDFSLFRNV